MIYGVPYNTALLYGMQKVHVNFQSKSREKLTKVVLINRNVGSD
jgi:hypothetical protein